MESFDVEKKVERVRRFAGDRFHTKTGLEFTYTVEGNSVYTTRTEYAISLSDFRKVLELVPLKGPGEINWVVRGPSYIWAILHDPRIAEGDW